ncbi:helix-turn-helix domain-containing protein [Methyloradius palustris]|uniref:HTH cro/C1-type domain-containing protein n=1 Tax=Methyloradius palustris TaxID=2778876 RepID=A0A8D5G5R2_9PROT|nr:helix-turn-helix domain-containing protein [Methyloradius palustris]BCM23826.1 hypothetical protein ZMTM_00850 [Methyloradius palustris]
MAIKKEYALTRAEFDEAIVTLRLNVSEVSKETNIPRSYMSEFRNGDRQLRPEHLAKLKDYFESKGIVFEDSPPEPASHPPATLPNAPPLAAAPYKFLPVYLDVDQPAVIKTQGVIQDNDARLAVLLQQTASRDDGFFSESEFSEDTQEALQEVFTLMAANYVLWRSLSGWPALGLSASGADPQTIKDIVFETFREALVKAGLFRDAPPDEPDEEAETEEELPA